MFKYWIDNRDLRDKNYIGPVIVPYDETNYRHREVRGEENKASALTIMENILQVDLVSLKERLEAEIIFQKESEQTPEELKFTEFYKHDFYSLIRKEIIENKRRFLIVGTSKILTEKELNRLWGEQSQEFMGHSLFPGLNPKTHVTSSEIWFQPIYKKYKNKIGWLHDKSPVHNFKYNSEESLKTAIKNCKARLEDINKIRNGEEI